MEIICTNGYIALNGLLTATQSYGEESITYYKKDLQAKTGKIGKPREHTMCFDSDKSWDLEMDEFYEAVRNNKEVVNGKPSDAVRVMRIISEIYHAL
jgi:predicted dehydrogenase